MAVPPTLIQVPFAGGIDQSQRAEVVDPSTAWTTLENMRQHTRGSMGKRYGFTAQTTSRLSGSRSAGFKLFALALQACCIDGHYLDVYSPTAGVNVTRDRVPEASVKRLPVQYTGLTPYRWELIYVNGYLIAAVTSTDGSTITLSTLVIDATSYTTLKQETFSSAMPIAALTGPRLVNIGNTIALVYQSGTNTISGRTMSVSSSSGINTGWSGTTSLVTDAHASGYYDAHGMETRFALAYANTSGGTDQLSIETFNSSLTSVDSTTVNTSSATPTFSSISLAGSEADTLWVSWGETATLKACGLDGGNLSSVLATTVSAFTANEVNNAAMVVTGTGTARITAASNYSSQRYRYSSGLLGISGGAATIGSTYRWWWMVNAGRPILVDSRVYAPVHYATIDGENNDNALFFVDVSEDSGTVRPVASIAPGLAYGSQTGSPHTAQISSTKYAVLTPVQRTGTVTRGVGAGLELAVLDFADPTRWQPAQDATSCTLSGGITTYFDGTSVCEAAFLVRPGRPPNPTVNAAAGSITISVGWRYVVVYEHVDAAGNVHTSGVSDPSGSTGAIASKQDVAVVVPNLYITSRYDASNTAPKVRVVLYRTTDGGSLYYRLGELTNTTSFSESTYTDTTVDATLTANALLYRQPVNQSTSLDRRAPPGFRAVTFYNDMLVGVADDGYTLWPSAQPVIGEGRWWSPALQVPIYEGGDITALAAQDGTLFAFKRRSIFAVTGDAPSDNGLQGGLGAPRRLAVDVGCIDPRSVVVTSLGVFFQSERGIELLTRSQSVEWVGEAIQDTTTSYPICTAATLDPSQNVVLFELASAETSNQVSGTGRTAVFDLAVKSWVSTDRRKNSAGTADTPAQSGAIIYTGSAYRYAWLGTDGRVYAEDRTYLDPGSAWITMRAESAWFKLSGVQGWQAMNRLLILGKRSTDHDLSLSLAYEYSDTYKTAQVWTDTALDAVNAAWPRQQLEHQLHDDAEGRAVRLKFEDATPTGGTVGTGEGATWIALAFEGAAREGAAKLPEASR